MVLGLVASITLPVEAAKVYRIEGNPWSKSCVIVNGQVCNVSEIEQPEGDNTETTVPGGNENMPELEEEQPEENIAWGQKSPEQVMDAWMNSEGHRANILNAKFTKMGVGHY